MDAPDPVTPQPTPDPDRTAFHPAPDPNAADVATRIEPPPSPTPEFGVNPGPADNAFAANPAPPNNAFGVNPAPPTPVVRPQPIPDNTPSIGDETAFMPPPPNALPQRQPIPDTPQGQKDRLRDVISADPNLTPAQRGVFDAMARGNRSAEDAAAAAIIEGGLSGDTVLRQGVADPADLRDAMARYLDEFTDETPESARRIIDDATARTGDTLRQLGVNDTAAKIAENKVPQYGSDYATAALGYSNGIEPEALIATGRFSEDSLRQGLSDYLRNERGIDNFADRQRAIDDWFGRPEPPSRLEGDLPTNNDFSNRDLRLVTDAGEVSDIAVGDRLANGSTSAAYRDRTHPDRVVRVNHPEGFDAGDGRPIRLSDLQRAQTMDDAGRRGLAAVSDTSPYIADVPVYDSHMLPDGRRIESVGFAPGEEASKLLDRRAAEAIGPEAAAELAELQGVRLPTPDQKARRDELIAASQAARRFDEAEAEAIAGAIDDLNEAGYVVLDGHVHNFSVVRDGDDVKVAFFDPGGIVPVRGLDPALARSAQQRALVPSQEEIDFAQRFGDVEGFWAGPRDEVMGDISEAINFAELRGPTPITPENMSFKPSLGYENPEVAEAWMAFQVE